MQNTLLQDCLSKETNNIMFNIPSERDSKSYFKIISDAYFLLFSYAKVFFVYDSIIMPNKICPQ